MTIDDVVTHLNACNERWYVADIIQLHEPIYAKRGTRNLYRVIMRDIQESDQVDRLLFAVVQGEAVVVLSGEEARPFYNLLPASLQGNMN